MKIISWIKKKFLKEKENIPDAKMIPVIMFDGTIQEYHERFQITDGINCIVCRGETYHTNFNCPSLKIERDIYPVKAMRIREAEHQGIYYCWRCKQIDTEDY